MKTSEVRRVRQPVLKPQDLVVALKLSGAKDRLFTYSQLAEELFMSTSEVHAACARAEASRLLAREDARFVPISAALREFAVYGVKYAFPAVIGPVERGIPTAVGALPLRDMFSAGDSLPPVWADPNGTVRGISVVPLYQSAPSAALADARLYELLALIDAIRSGAAREREAATAELMRRV